MKRLIYLILGLVLASQSWAQVSGSSVSSIGAAKASACPSTNTQTGTTYTLAVSDANNCITNNNSSPITDTIPTNATQAILVGSTITIEQLGAGIVTITPATGVTLNFPGSNLVAAGNYTAPLTTSGPFTSVTLLKTATNTWWVFNSNSPMSTPQYYTVWGGTAPAGSPATFSMSPKLSGTGTMTFGAGPSSATSNQAQGIMCSGQEGGTPTYYQSLFQISSDTYFVMCGSEDSSDFLISNPQTDGDSVFDFIGGNNTSDGMYTIFSMSSSSNCSDFVTAYVTGTLSGPCSLISGDSGGSNQQPLVIAASTGMGTFSSVGFFGTNSTWFGVGNTAPVQFINATSTGSNNAAVTLGDTNTSSTTAIKSGTSGTGTTISGGKLNINGITNGGTASKYVCVDSSGNIVVQVAAC